MEEMDAEMKLKGRPKFENRRWTMTKSPSGTIVPGSYLRVGGRLLMRSNRPHDREQCACCVGSSELGSPVVTLVEQRIERFHDQRFIFRFNCLIHCFVSLLKL